MTGETYPPYYCARLYTQKKEDQTDFCIWVAQQGMTALLRSDNTVGITHKKRMKVHNPKAGDIVVIHDGGVVDLVSEEEFKVRYVD